LVRPEVAGAHQDVSVQPPVQPNRDSRAIQAKLDAQNNTLLELADKLSVETHGCNTGTDPARTSC
jgi:type V secretory pathway adhesin AidA